MKLLVATLMMAFATFALAKEQTKKVEPQITDAVTVPKPIENTNCVKKDKNGKCPPLPNSPKPTPKKPAEKK